jgi:hypothetical protein
LFSPQNFAYVPGLIKRRLIVARIIKEIEIEGKPAVALFDTGAVYTYMRSSYLTNVPN